jgi:large conductance mechanosensitive channel
MKKFMKEFKEFALKGNMMDLAIGMMIGAAFGKIVTSLVSDILMPLISGIFRIQDFTALKVLLVDKGGENNVYLNYGTFIQNILDFIIVAFCVFLLMKAVDKIRVKPEPVKEEPKISDETKALNEIIGILKENKKN